MIVVASSKINDLNLSFKLFKIGAKGLWFVVWDDDDDDDLSREFKCGIIGREKWQELFGNMLNYIIVLYRVPLISETRIPLSLEYWINFSYHDRV